MNLVWLLIAGLSVHGCGSPKSKDKSDPTTTGPDSGTDGVTSPSDITAAGITALAPKKLANEQDALQSLISWSYKNWEAPTPSQTCIRSKIKFGPAGSDGFSSSEDKAIDASDCFTSADFGGGQFKFSTYLIAKEKLIINDVPIDLSGKSLADKVALLAADDVKSYTDEFFQQGRIVVSTTINSVSTKLENRLLRENGPGGTCKISKEKDGKQKSGPCRNYQVSILTDSTKAQTVDGFAITDGSTPLEADGFKSPWFNSGSSTTVTINNWKAAITFLGADIAPKVTLTSDTGQKVVGLSIFGKSMFVTDELYSLSCNINYLDFLVRKENTTCKAITHKEDFSGGGSTWKIASPDGAVAISAVNPTSSQKLKIDGTDYFCMLYSGSGSVFDSAGKQQWSPSHLIISKSAATKPSDLKTDDVLLIATSSQDVCHGIY